MIVPPWWTMPRTDSRDNRTTPPFGYSSGVSRPLNPSRIPTTSQPRLRAASVAARITAFSPGASPPPVLMAMRLISAATRGLYRQPGAAAEASGCEQHPPERLSALDVAMGVGGLGEREDLIDHDLQLALCDAMQQPLDHRPDAVRVVPHLGAEEDARDRRVLLHQRPHLRRAGLPPGPTDPADPPAVGEGRDAAFERGATDGIDDDVDAAAVGDLAHPLRHVLRRVVDAVVHPVLGEAAEPLVARRGADDDAGTGCLGELDGGQADTTGAG